MKEPNVNSADEKLSGLLRAARATPSLPPRFQEKVWRRIERAESESVSSGGVAWLEAITAWVLRPRLALAVAAVLILAGLGLGWSSGEQMARQEAQARYVAAVAPNPLR